MSHAAPKRDEHNRGDDQCAGGEDAAGQGLVEKDPAEDDCDEWIDKSVGGNARGGADLKQPDVGGEANERAEDEQVEKCDARRGGDRAEVEAVVLAENESREKQERAAGDHLHRDGEERGFGLRGVAREDGTGGPAERGGEEDEGSERCGDVVARLIFARNDEADADEAEDESGEDGWMWATSAGPDPVENDHPERRAGDDERGDV